MAVAVTDTRALQVTDQSQMLERLQHSEVCYKVTSSANTDTDDCDDQYI